MPRKLVRSCGGCVFFVPRADVSHLHGECRRFPPQPSSISGDKYVNVRGVVKIFLHVTDATAPVVKASHWCGEWRRKQ